VEKHNPKQPTILKNLTCAYCGCSFSATKVDTKEHVVARRFVPKGTLAGSWNLILRACDSCNSEKAELEDDISALSLQALAYQSDLPNDPIVSKEIARKAPESLSRTTKKPVADSEQSMSFSHASQPGLSFNFFSRALRRSNSIESSSWRTSISRDSSTG